MAYIDPYDYFLYNGCNCAGSNCLDTIEGNVHWTEAIQQNFLEISSICIIVYETASMAELPQCIEGIGWDFDA